MKTQKNYSSKEEAEKKNPYVIVEFNVYNNETVATIVKSFSKKKSADNYCRKHFVNAKNIEVMTRTKYNREALMCM